MSLDDRTDLARAVLRSSSVQAAIQLVADHYGVDHVTVHLMRNAKSGADNPFVRTTYPAAWVSHYLLSNYVAIDPIVHHGLRSSRAFCWSELSLNGAQQAMLRAALEFNLGGQGYTVPAKDHLGRRSLLSLNSRMGAVEWATFLAQHGASIDSLAKDLHVKALAESSVSGPEPLALSPREHECLVWTAEGKTYSEIAIILDLSEHTVRSYLKVVRLKLDSVSMPQAVAKASNLGLI